MGRCSALVGGCCRVVPVWPIQSCVSIKQKTIGLEVSMSKLQGGCVVLTSGASSMPVCAGVRAVSSD